MATPSTIDLKILSFGRLVIHGVNGCQIFSNVSDYQIVSGNIYDKQGIVERVTLVYANVVSTLRVFMRAIVSRPRAVRLVRRRSGVARRAKPARLLERGSA